MELKTKYKHIRIEEFPALGNWYFYERSGKCRQLGETVIENGKHALYGTALSLMPSKCSKEVWKFIRWLNKNKKPKIIDLKFLEIENGTQWRCINLASQNDVLATIEYSPLLERWGATEMRHDFYFADYLRIIADFCDQLNAGDK